MSTEIMGVPLFLVCFVAIAVIFICVGIRGFIEIKRESNRIREFEGELIRQEVELLKRMNKSLNGETE